jgi:hypothetical protein
MFGTLPHVMGINYKLLKPVLKLIDWVFEKSE